MFFLLNCALSQIVSPNFLQGVVDQNLLWMGNEKESFSVISLICTQLWGMHDHVLVAGCNFTLILSGKMMKELVCCRQYLVRSSSQGNQANSSETLNFRLPTGIRICKYRVRLSSSERALCNPVLYGHNNHLLPGFSQKPDTHTHTQATSEEGQSLHAKFKVAPVAIQSPFLFLSARHSF